MDGWPEPLVKLMLEPLAVYPWLSDIPMGKEGTGGGASPPPPVPAALPDDTLETEFFLCNDPGLDDVARLEVVFWRTTLLPVYVVLIDVPDRIDVTSLSALLKANRR